jgi:hypothetical protein
VLAVACVMRNHAQVYDADAFRALVMLMLPAY